VVEKDFEGELRWQGEVQGEIWGQLVDLREAWDAMQRILKSGEHTEVIETLLQDDMISCHWDVDWPKMPGFN
jgi:hypothetical protein